MVDENLSYSQNKAKVEKNLKMSEEVIVSEPTGDTEEQRQANGQLQRVGGRQSYESHVLFDMKGSSRRDLSENEYERAKNFFVKEVTKLALADAACSVSSNNMSSLNTDNDYEEDPFLVGADFDSHKTRILSKQRTTAVE